MTQPSLPVPDFPGLTLLVVGHGLDQRFKDSDAEGFYAFAYLLVQQRRFLDAGKIFCLLGLYRPMELRVWQGMALCAREIGAYNDALRALRRCNEIAPDELEFLFAAADCALLAGRRSQAILLLNEVVRLGREQDRPEHVSRALDQLARLEGASDESQH